LRAKVRVHLLTALHFAIADGLGIRGFYDGLTGTLVRQLTYSMARFAIYEDVSVVYICKLTCRPRRAYTLVRPLTPRALKLSLRSEPGPMPVWKMGVAGSLAGAIAGAACNPAEAVMVSACDER
jgi:dicarboxylate transporter 10